MGASLGGGRRSHAGLRAVTGGLALVLIAVAPALARTPGACAGDVEQHCKGIEPGAGRIFSCLRSHGSELSPECKQALKDIKRGPGKRRWLQSSKAWAEACTGDIQSLCKDIPAGAGRIAECLKQHEATLSPACKAAFAPTPTQ